MQKLRGSPHIIVLLFYFLCLWSKVTGFCPIPCDCDDDSLRVICDNANLSIVPLMFNPELKELRLSNNHIGAVKTHLSVYHGLVYLDISSNEIVILDNGNFKEQKNLKFLNLNNNKIYLLHEGAFLGLNSLKELYLHKNSLVNLSSEIFIHLPNLEHLDISQNKIKFIDEKAFLGLKNLRILSLRNNELSVIPNASFQYVSKLYKLDLGQNSFRNIPESSFASLTDLHELILDSCGIRIIIQGAFKWLSSLVVLHIHNNELKEIPTKALFDVIHLEELHIGQNIFFDIKPKAFQRLSNLSTIDISGCQFLEYVRENVFTDNPNLETIIMNRNKVLRHIQDGAFANLLQIKHVSFRGNAFETFKPTLLPWAELVSLDVRDNPFVCNCSLLWLWELLLTKNYSSFDGLSDSTQVVCANPPELRGTIFSSLQEVDLECNSLDGRQQIIISIILGAALASAAVVVIVFRYRNKLAGALKTKWGYGRKETQYQKTSVEVENTILQVAHQSLKLTPVTEL